MMNNENDLKRDREEEVFDLRLLLFKLLDRWWWFAISVPICLLVAIYVCLSSTPVYQVGTKVMISDSKKGEVGVNPMMKELGLFQGNLMVENEMVELMSKNLVAEVVKELELNVSYTRERLPRDLKLYDTSPVKVLVDMPEYIRDTTLYLVLSRDGVKVLDAERKLVLENGYSRMIPMGKYHLSVEKQDSIMKEEGEIRVDLLSYKTATNRFYSQLSVNLLEKNTNAVRVSVKDVIPGRGEDILLALIRRYNDNGVSEKQLVSAKTVEFINNRLRVINRELGDIESDAERFKKKNQLTDIASDAAFVMERKKSAESELLKLSTELDVVKSVRVYLENRDGEEFRLLPEQLGLTDESLNSGIGKYNEMVLRRGKLMLSARESNPIVMGLEAQLRDMKNNILLAMANVEKGLDIKIKSLKRESDAVDEKLTSVPTQEKLYRSIARQQELKENLFLFLMQKREEAEIGKLMYVPMAKIIENPGSGDAPIAPRKALIMLVGLLLGFAFPVGGILLADAWDTRVKEVADVERVVSFPLLGTLPQLPEDKTSVEDEDFMMTESMHLIRENLNYLVNLKESPVIMVSSTIPREGKSLVAAHLANAYAAAGKKVVVIGCDLRNPNLSFYFKRENRQGLSAYLAGMVEEPDSIVEKVNDNLHVIFAGAVPPNPTRLVASPRMGVLLEYLKREYSCIILDTPPLGILADGFSLSEHADAYVYVVRANLLDKRGLRVLEELEKGGRMKNLGIVVNGLKFSRSGSYGYGYGCHYGYGYGYGYGQEPGKKKK